MNAPGDDYYGDGEPQSMETEKNGSDDKHESGKTYLINKEVCPDMKPGDEMVVKIERVLENEYEVSYAPEKEHEEESSTPPEPSPMGGGMGDYME